VLPSRYRLSLTHFDRNPCAYRASTDKYRGGDWTEDHAGSSCRHQADRGRPLLLRGRRALLRRFGLFGSTPAWASPFVFAKRWTVRNGLGLAWTAFPRGALAPPLNPESSRHSMHGEPAELSARAVSSRWKSSVGALLHRAKAKLWTRKGASSAVWFGRTAGLVMGGLLRGGSVLLSLSTRKLAGVRLAIASQSKAAPLLSLRRKGQRS
jgi:hypothetical protein